MEVCQMGLPHYRTDNLYLVDLDDPGVNNPFRLAPALYAGNTLMVPTGRALLCRLSWWVVADAVQYLGKLLLPSSC